MPSHHEVADYVCESCRSSVHAKIWVIVDGLTDPDLAEQIRLNSIHTISCNCGASVHYDAPLLFFHLRATPAVLYSPSWETSAEEDQNVSEWLINKLRDQLGNSWRPKWIEDGLPWLWRHELSSIFSNGQFTPIKPHWKRLDRLDPLVAGLASVDLAARFELIRNNPVLLEDHADIYLKHQIEQAIAQNQPQFRTTLEAIRTTTHIARCSDDQTEHLKFMDFLERCGPSLILGLFNQSAISPLSPQTIVKLRALIEPGHVAAEKWLLGIRGRALGDFRLCIPEVLEEKIELLRKAVSGNELRRALVSVRKDIESSESVVIQRR
jgi:hypothetical protein